MRSLFSELRRVLAFHGAARGNIYFCYSVCFFCKRRHDISSSGRAQRARRGGTALKKEIQFGRLPSDLNRRLQKTEHVGILFCSATAGRPGRNGPQADVGTQRLLAASCEDAVQVKH